MRGKEAVFDVSGLNDPATVIQDLSGVTGARIITGNTVLAAGTANNTEYAGTFEGNGGYAKQGSGTMVLTGNSQAFAGKNEIREGVLQVDGELGGQSLRIASGATLSGRGAVGGQVTAHGGSTITPAGNDMGTLTLTGDFVGEPNSKIVIQTTLGGDDSPTDRLLIKGNSTGTAIVHVENVNGKGALTKNGIKVIDVEGNSEAKFVLDQGFLRAGAYEYRLYQNSPADPTDGDWYLRSSNYQPLVGNYITTLAANTATGQLVLGDLHQRLGVPYDMQRNKGLLWVRALGEDASHDGKHNFQFDQTSTGFQLGANVFKAAQGDNLHLVGVTSQYVHGSIKSRDQQRADAGLAASTGTAKSETYGMGLTYTLVHNNDSYLDIVGQVNRVENKLTDSNQEQSRLRGWQYTLSAEVGKAFAVAPSLTVEPQAQLSYVVTSYDTAHDDENRIDADTTKALQLRLGTQVNKTFLVKKHPVQAYVLANYRHDFAHDNSVLVTDLTGGQRDEISDAQGKDSFELGVGVQGKFSEKAYVYGDIRQQRSFSSGFNNRINVGLKYLF